MTKFSFDYKGYHIIVNPAVDNIIEAYCDSENDHVLFRIDYHKDYEDKDKLIKVIESGLKVRIQKNIKLNSLEALEQLYEFALSSEPMELTIKDFKDIILKDLEVLEIIKKSFSKDFLAERLKDAYLRDDLNDEDYEKVEEWLGRV